MIFQARRGSGKTHLIKHITRILAAKGKFDWIKCVTPTAFNGEWRNAIGQRAVHESLDTDWLLALLDRQADSIEEGIQNRGLLILDDCLGCVKFNSPIWTKIAASSRHYSLTVIISSQHFTKLPPIVRSNADYIFILGHQPARTIKNIYEEYSPKVGLSIVTEEAFTKYLEDSTTDYGSVLIDTASCKCYKIKAPKSSTLKIRQ